MEQKIVISDSEDRINIFINEGWKVVSITPQYVAVESTSWNTIRSKFCFLLERPKQQQQ